jgi:hypothetical protein
MSVKGKEISRGAATLTASMKTSHREWGRNEGLMAGGWWLVV